MKKKNSVSVVLQKHGLRENLFKTYWKNTFNKITYNAKN